MKFFIAILFLSFGFLNVSAQRAEALIQSKMDAQVIAWNTGNLEAFMEPYWKSDSLTFIGKSGITYGWKNTLERYKKGYPDAAAMGTLQFDILHIQKTGKRYRYVTGKWKLMRSIGDVQGHFTLIFKKIKGEWFIISDHSS